MRVALGIVALLELWIVVPQLFLGHDQGAPAHLAHEMGALGLGLAVGFAVAALRPSRAVGMSAVVLASAAGLLITSITDLVGGLTTVSHEIPHLVAAAGAIILWKLARSAPDDGLAEAGRRTSRAVELRSKDTTPLASPAMGYRPTRWRRHERGAA
ncbi:MAG: hypothetical protein ACYC1D_15775 [Acidimicrobiales bacterium]